MAILTKLKKGGIARWVLKGATSGDSFVVPRGFKILGPITVENTAQLNGIGTLSLGKTVGVNATWTMTITTAITAVADTIVFGGGIGATTLVASAAQVAVVTGLTGAPALAATASLVASLSGTLPPGGVANLGGWSVTASAAVCTFTCLAPGVPTTPTVTFGSTTLSSGGMIAGVTGSNDATFLSPMPINATAMGAVSLLPIIASPSVSTSMLPYGSSSVAVPSTNGNSQTVTFTNAAGAAGSYVLNGSTYSIPNGMTAPATGAYMGGRSVLIFTISAGGAGNYTMNGVTVTSSATPATAATNLAGTYIPGWMMIASTATVTMYATRPGMVPFPVYVPGTGSITGYATPTYSQLGFYQNGYVNDSTTAFTNTIAFTGAVATNAATYAINGKAFNAPLIATTALTANQTAMIAGGCAYYYFTIATSATGTNYINGALFTANATPATTATNLAALVNIPGRPGDAGGWVVTCPTSADILMIAQTPGYMSVPVFSAGAVAAPTLSASPGWQQGFTLAGYTVDLGTAGSTKWTGPSPVFTVLTAPGTQTIARTFTVAATGSCVSYTDQQNYTGASSPSFSGALTTQTWARTTTAADASYYLNFSNSGAHGNVNVTVELEKFS